jgi:hypothetical protein
VGRTQRRPFDHQNYNRKNVLSTRRVEIGGIARCANGLWMAQIARNLTDAVEGFFTGKRYLIHDRDPLYTKEFLSIVPCVAGLSDCRIVRVSIGRR